MFRILQFQFRPGWFLLQIFPFVFQWLCSRPWSKLLLGLPAGICSTALALIAISVDSESSRLTLSAKYFDHGVRALKAGSAEQAELCFARSASLVHDPHKVQFAAAENWLQHNEQQHGLAILETLAPLAYRGYVPAHIMLAEHYATLSPQTDVSQLKCLYHKIHADSGNQSRRCELAEFLSQRGYHSRALECLRMLKSPSPATRLTLARVYSRAGRADDARKEVEESEQNLRKMLKDSPDDHAAWILLSQVIAYQRRPLDAVFTLAEQCRREAKPEIVDELLRCYTVWLSQMPPHVQHVQIKQLATLFCANKDDVTDLTTVELRLSSGNSVRLPKPVAELHHRLLTAEGRWLVPLLQGTEFASNGLWDQAVQELRIADELFPHQPIVMNNLAFAMLKQHQVNDSIAENSDVAETTQRSSLQQAWEYADMAVTAREDVAGFRETRGQIAAVMGRWDDAVDDLEHSLRQGHDSADLISTLSKARDQSQNRSR